MLANIQNSRQRIEALLPKSRVKNRMFFCDDVRIKSCSISKLITAYGADTNVPQIKELFDYPELVSPEQGSLPD